MNKLAKQFSELRKNTPKRVQWLLLAAAFVVVLIMLTLMMNKTETTPDLSMTKSEYAKLKLTTDNIDWANTTVGETKSETIKINSTKPVKITKISVNKDDIPGFKYKDTCGQIGQIDSKLSCSIELTYSPTSAQKQQENVIYVDWHDADASDSMTSAQQIKVILGAQAPEVSTPQPEPQPDPIPEPVVIDTEETEEEPILFDEEPEIQTQIVEEVEAIAPSVEFEEIMPTRETSKQACSDFAFPGYNDAGLQIGWIKPEGGSYKFHPFSDTNCDSPTGTYNPDNGIIIDNSGNRIGTDAEHISYSVISNGVLPALSNTPAIKPVHRATQLDAAPDALPTSGGAMRLSLGNDSGATNFGGLHDAPPSNTLIGTSGSAVQSTQAYDRTFVLRQYKPIPATIVSDVRADPEALKNNTLPVRATVDRNVYSDNGRTVIIPAGTMLLGYVTGKLPGPYTSVGRMEIKWYQFILPNGVEFQFADGQDPFSGDAQGRTGVPGHGSTDYIEQFFMPMLTAIVPAAVNLIAPISDAFVNQIDLDNNTVVQSGTLRSSELAKNEIITAWNQVAQKLLVDMMDNTVPPFTIAAGTRITVYSPNDLQVVCHEEGKKCSVSKATTGSARTYVKHNYDTPDYGSADWVGQARSFNMSQYCDNGKIRQDAEAEIAAAGLDYRTVLFYCQSSQYKAINQAKQEAIYENQQDANNTNSIANISDQGTKAYNEQVLGLTYDEDTGAIQNPFNAPAETTEEANTLTCIDGSAPDANGCCTGEVYTDMGPEMGFNCCPTTGGDCFPPLI